ncbi:unnamed protein product [Clavelina lepadiformis]|uniref:Glutathione peroxidase n=1 Tax=Clavelina lepadiformis TaxID=159417 RepID=A0ABP0H155_CLALP
MWLPRSAVCLILNKSFGCVASRSSSADCGRCMSRKSCFSIFILGLLAVLLSRYYTTDMAESGKDTPTNIYGFTVKDIDGNDVSLSKYKGLVSVIVNVASA